MTDKLADALKPCPFCGECSTHIQRAGVDDECTYTQCKICEAGGPTCFPRDAISAADAWNTRHEAAKAATPDDVRRCPECLGSSCGDVCKTEYNYTRKSTIESLKSIKGYGHSHRECDACGFDPKEMTSDIDKAIGDIAALRQGVTIDVYAELIYLRYCHSIGAAGADWNAVECKDVWREKAILDQNARGG